MSEITLNCPNGCGNNLAYNTSKRVGHCWVCKKVFVKYVDAEPEIHELTVPLPNLEIKPAREVSSVREYLERRRHLPEGLFAGRQGKDQGWGLYVPIWSPSPEYHPTYIIKTPGQKGWRTLPGTKKEHYVFGTPCPPRVVLVEGAFDALRIGEGAVALLGTQMYPTVLEWLKRTVCEVLLWLDPDKAGREATARMLKRFESWNDGYEAGWGEIRCEKEPDDCFEGHETLNFVRGWLKR